MSTREDDAVRLLDEVAAAAIEGTPQAIETAVRKYAAACEVMRWRAEADAAWLEVNGYAGQPANDRRQVTVTKKWVPSSSMGMLARVHAATRQQMDGGRSQIPPEETVNLYLPHPLGDLVPYAEKGWMEPAGDAPKSSRDSRGTYTFECMYQVPPSALRAIFDRTGRWVHRAAVDAQVALKYGAEVETRRTRLRATVDEPLAAHGLGDYLDEIDRGLNTGTPAGRRSALYACRSLLTGLADRLWLDERPTYTPLSGGGVGGKLDVTTANPKNRLAAYLHQHLGGESTAPQRKYLEAEVDRLWESIARLYDLSNDGHDDDVAQVDAEMAAIGAYLLVGELARRTNLKPIEQYEV